MKPRHFAILILGFVAMVGCGNDAGRENNTLDGTWVVESVVRDPREDNSDEGKGLRIIVHGDKVVAKLPGKEEPVGAVRIQRDLNQDPDALNFLINGDQATVRAIYEVKDATLLVCWSPPGEERPSEFASKPGSGHTLAVLNRADLPADRETVPKG